MIDAAEVVPHPAKIRSGTAGPTQSRQLVAYSRFLHSPQPKKFRSQKNLNNKIKILVDTELTRKYDLKVSL